MCDDQYDVSPKMKRLFEIKQKERAAAKQYYQNLLYNPHRPGNDGVPFDPQLQRYGAMSAYHIDFYKPKGTHIFGFVMCLTPFFFTYWALCRYKRNQEALLRSGQVKYSDREFKFIY